MYSVVVADDEKLARKGLVSLINWSESDFEVIGEASNGEMVLDIILKQIPDLIITDIKMPGMDGIELIKKVKTQYPSVQIVVLSGFDDYKYVRETLKYGVLDYFLKADFESSEITNILQKVKEIKHNNMSVAPVNEENSHISYDIDYDLLKSMIATFDCNQITEHVKQIILANDQLTTIQLNRLCIDIFYFIFYRVKEKGYNLSDIENNKLMYFSAFENSTTADELISIFTAIFQKINTSITNNSHHTYSKTIQNVIDYVYNNYQNDVSLETTATNLFISKSYLCNLFKKQKKINYSEFVNTVRIEKAKELLSSGDYLIREVAEMVGYNNTSYFCKLFKEIEGITAHDFQYQHYQ